MVIAENNSSYSTAPDSYLPVVVKLSVNPLHSPSSLSFVPIKTNMKSVTTFSTAAIITSAPGLSFIEVMEPFKTCGGTSIQVLFKSVTPNHWDMSQHWYVHLW